MTDPLQMHVGSFARYWRRRELACMVPYFALSAGLVVGCIVLVACRVLGLGAWLVLFCMLSPAWVIPYFYVWDLLRGRTIHAPAGMLALVDARQALTIQLGRRATTVQITEIATAKLITAECFFEDPRGLEDVLELRLVTGVVVRIPGTCEPFWPTVRELGGVIPIIQARGNEA